MDLNRICWNLFPSADFSRAASIHIWQMKMNRIIPCKLSSHKGGVAGLIQTRWKNVLKEMDMTFPYLTWCWFEKIVPQMKVRFTILSRKMFKMLRCISSKNWKPPGPEFWGACRSPDGHVSVIVRLEQIRMWLIHAIFSSSIRTSSFPTSLLMTEVSAILNEKIGFDTEGKNWRVWKRWSIRQWKDKWQEKLFSEKRNRTKLTNKLMKILYINSWLLISNCRKTGKLEICSASYIIWKTKNLYVKTYKAHSSIILLSASYLLLENQYINCFLGKNLLNNGF